MLNELILCLAGHPGSVFEVSPLPLDDGALRLAPSFPHVSGAERALLGRLLLLGDAHLRIASFIDRTRDGSAAGLGLCRAAAVAALDSLLGPWRRELLLAERRLATAEFSPSPASTVGAWVGLGGRCAN